jgi:hypothetical protein
MIEYNVEENLPKEKRENNKKRPVTLKIQIKIY